MPSYTLTNEQARNFLLFKQGLLGEYKFHGKPGVLDFVRQAGCIQFDPIDICGKNAEMVLQSRVADFSKAMLDQLLYTDRKLVDYFDKNMAIWGVEDWKYFARFRELYTRDGRSREQVDAVAGEVKRIVAEKEFACSQDLPLNEAVDWSWSPTRLSRAALETLYFRGELVIHHKKGTVKYYSLAEDLLDPAILHAADPNETREDFLKWRILRRIGAVGLLWNRPSDAWLQIGGFLTAARERVFAELLAEKKIVECRVEGVPVPLYLRAEDEPVLQASLTVDSFPARLEFLAPLDSLLWDRNLIRAIFHFDYKWEIYTPVVQRKYGYYVLPVLYGSRLIGRIEPVVDKKKKQLRMANFWKEEGVEMDADMRERLEERLVRFAKFNGCEYIPGGDL